MTRAQIHIQLLAILWLLGACSDDTGFVSVGDELDSGLGADAAADSGGLDGGHGGGGGTGSSNTLPDGALIDAGDEDGGVEVEIDPTEACEVAEMFNEYSRKVDFPHPGGFSLTTGETGFGLAFQSEAGGDALNTMPVDGAGQFGKPTRLLYESGSTIRDVTLLWTATGGWRMAWVDNFAGSGELELIALTDGLRVPGGAMRTTLTDNTLVETRPVLADIAGVPMLAWIAADMKGDKRISLKRLEASSEIVDVVPKSAGHSPASLALTRVGQAGAALAWVEESGQRGVWMQKVDGTGKASGAPVQLSDKAYAGSSVDLATRDDEGAGVIYSVAIGGVNDEVRFRRLDRDGNFTGEDKRIVGGALQGTDASIARLGGGYVVAYRALPGGIITKPAIHITFISKEGNAHRDRQGRLMTYQVAEAGGNGGRTTVRVSLDGQVLVGFLDGNGNMKLARQRLDCQ